MRLDRPELKTYSRRKRNDKPEEAIMQSADPAESSPIGQSPIFPYDSNVPIAHRKGVSHQTSSQIGSQINCSLALLASNSAIKPALRNNFDLPIWQSKNRL
ncbi:hypothetical protein G2W53_002536 [Senna tora]|uniref:Uncharacterized protein n=1 Tax=Senna tora TaxID=362788 RepID=A0A834XKR0_9FABA|nr:hypothetical protein G2W53_002536 [Senna tora]